MVELAGHDGAGSGLRQAMRKILDQLRTMGADAHYVLLKCGPLAGIVSKPMFRCACISICLRKRTDVLMRVMPSGLLYSGCGVKLCTVTKTGSSRTHAPLHF